jgi:hypothetical protein
MVSMVIILFLVAVVISLFLGRLAETLTIRFRERLRPPLAGEHRSVQKPDGGRGSTRSPKRDRHLSQADPFHSLPAGPNRRAAPYGDRNR